MNAFYILNPSQVDQIHRNMKAYEKLEVLYIVVYLFIYLFIFFITWHVIHSYNSKNIKKIITKSETRDANVFSKQEREKKEEKRDGMSKLFQCPLFYSLLSLYTSLQLN